MSVDQAKALAGMHLNQLEPVVLNGHPNVRLSLMWP